ncbi:MAG: isoprenylcysteine carboxylmethyltransferase family protein [Bacteroidota bacterium]
MSLIPNFEIGVWNAWIIMLYTIIITPLLMINKGALRDEIRKQPGGVRESQFTDKHNKIEKKAFLFWHIIYFLGYIYSIFLPLKLGTTWFYIGLPICLLGLIIYTRIIVDWITTPTETPITKGIYRYSRHPMYLSPFLIFIGVGIASASWVFLLSSIALLILPPFFVVPEERFLLQKYGDSYHDYMNRTPRWIGIPKSLKSD